MSGCSRTGFTDIIAFGSDRRACTASAGIAGAIADGVATFTVRAKARKTYSSATAVRTVIVLAHTSTVAGNCVAGAAPIVLVALYWFTNTVRFTG